MTAPAARADTLGAVAAIAYRLREYDAAMQAGDLAGARAHLANAAQVLRWAAVGIEGVPAAAVEVGS